MHRRLLALVGMMLASFCAFAEGDAEGTDSYFGDFPVVLSASRLVQTVDEAPAVVTVIDREMIRTSGAREVVDLFRLVPGIVVGQYKAHQPTLGFFGFSDPMYRQLQVLIDGVSIYSSAWGGAEWSELPISLEDIERIEVVRGPNAATFGANSFLGVVNIITRDPALEHDRELVVNIGEKRIRDLHMRYSVGDGDLRYRLTAGRRADDGLDSYPDSRRTNFLNLRLHLRLNANDELRVQTAYAGGAQENGVYGGEKTDGPRTAHYDSGSAQIRWTRVRGADEELWLQFSHSQRSFRDVVPYALDLSSVGFDTWDYPVDYSYERRRTDIEMQHTTRLADSIRTVWGGQARSDGVRSMTYLNSPDWLTSSLYRVFGNLEWRPAPGWIATGGAMLEKNSFTGSSASPSFAINRELIPNHTVRLRFASARRTPTLYEDRADWAYRLPAGLQSVLAGMGSTLANLPLVQSSLGNHDLKDEKVRSREISYLVKFPELHLNVEVHWFEHRVSDLIRAQNQPVQTVMGNLYPNSRHAMTLGFSNLGSTRITGTSAVIRWRPRQGTQVYFAGSRAKIRADGPDSYSIDASGPQNTVSVLASEDLPMDFQFGCGYYLVGPMRSLAAGDPLPRTEKVDLRLARKFRLWSKPAEAALVVQRANGGEPVFGWNDIDKRTAWLNMWMAY